ncbi:MAG: DUF1990 family protein [Chloroflexota bacterium]|nr:DUF1990 family protein [Chloroflexota bacterium]
MRLQPFKRQKSRHDALLYPIAAASAAATLFTIIMLRRWSMQVDASEIEVSATQPSPHHLRERDFAGERPLQLASDGEHDLYHRVYQVDIEGATFDPVGLMQHTITHLDNFVAGEMAQFEKTSGAGDQMQVGDEFFIHITGPWNGPVRVIDVQPTSFSFVTLEGHLEAGEIQFRVLEHPERENTIRFEIRSWARSRDRTTDFFYRVISISKYSQTRLWTFFCKRAVAESGGTMVGDIRVMTHKTRYQPEAQPLWRQYEPQFERWKTVDLNFDPAKRSEYTSVQGWHIDEYAIGLPSEAPGEPVPNGVWDAAKNVVLNYEFPDPNLVTGIFVPDAALNERIMIIRARFWLFTFLFGVRISQVIDETRDGGKRGSARVWGYGYRTLQGHFEMGEITFEVWKFIETGEVEFRMNAYSKPASISNPFYRLGFHLFGRGLQKRFADTALTRMQQLVIQRVAPSPAPETPIETPDVQPIVADDAASEKVETIQEEQNSTIDAQT